MNVYPILEIALIGLIGALSLYQVMKVVMPRVLQGARASVAQRLGRGATAASWRHALAVRVRDAVPEAACGAGCGGGCNGCSVAASARTPVRTGDEAAR
jgi:hypothetical protein